MTPAELKEALKSIGFPVAYSHFKVDDKNPPPTPPYITYQFAYDSDLIADNVNYAEISNFQVELYTTVKDLVSEAKVQDKFKVLGMPYSKLETWIDSEELFQIMYQIQLIGV